MGGGECYVPEPGQGIPALHGREALGAAAGIVAVGHVVHHLRVGIESRVDEAHGAFAGRDALLVDEVDDGAEGRRRCCTRRDVVSYLC